MTTKKHDVLICGGGPTGLMLAAELALAKVDVAVVERRLGQELEGSRAGGLHARTLELLDQRGVVERFLAAGKAMQVAGFGGTPLDISDFPTRHNYGLALSQEKFERVLAAWVAELPVTQYRGVEMAGCDADDAGVALTLADGRTLRGKYLAGCDGGRSRVRKSAGIAFAGWDASLSYLIAECQFTAETPKGIHRSDKGVYGIGPIDDGPFLRAVLVESEVRHGTPSLDDLRAALVSFFGSDFGVHGVRWLSRFSDATRQAATYRKGRVLLAGDAAHVHSPAGGQGLNTGVHDAVNLGWKLAQVVHGTSPDRLLDTYHAERHPVGAQVLRTTMAQTALARGDERTAALREAVSDLLKSDEARKRYAGLMSGLDIRYDLGAGHPLLGRRMPDLELGNGRRVYSYLHAAEPVLLDFAATPYAGPWNLPVLGPVPAPSAVLVRPDGYVAWVGESGSTLGLQDAMGYWFGR
jgi:2-polyprenyl-6-methoxyphenol hydroxylase-like FAD-dependent oxidoreductase